MKKILQQILLGTTLVLAFTHVQAEDKAELKEELKQDKSVVEAACVEEAKASGCEGKEIGKGLLKCVHAYKKEHKDFKFSDGCKSAMKELKGDRKKMKEFKKEQKEEKKSEG